MRHSVAKARARGLLQRLTQELASSDGEQGLAGIAGTLTAELQSADAEAWRALQWERAARYKDRRPSP